MISIIQRCSLWSRTYLGVTMLSMSWTRKMCKSHDKLPTGAEPVSCKHERRLRIVAGSTWRGDARLSHRSRLRPRSLAAGGEPGNISGPSHAPEPVGHVWQNDDIRPTGVEIPSRLADVRVPVGVVRVDVPQPEPCRDVTGERVRPDHHPGIAPDQDHRTDLRTGHRSRSSCTTTDQRRTPSTAAVGFLVQSPLGHMGVQVSRDTYPSLLRGCRL